MTTLSELFPDRAPGVSSIGRPRDEADLLAYARLVSIAFSAAPVGRAWWTREGPEGFRLAFGDGSGEVVGGMILVPMSWHFGGRAVPGMGLRGVAVDPAWRRRGVGTTLTRAALYEAREQGFPISVLYPSVYALYARLGYGVAGSRLLWEAPLAAFPRAPLGPGSRWRGHGPLAPGDPPPEGAVELSRQQRHEINGAQDRGDEAWRLLFSGGDPHPWEGWTLERGDESLAWLLAAPSRGEASPLLLIRDLAAATPAGLSGLMDFIGGFSATLDRARWPGGPADPLADRLPAGAATVHRCQRWMLRLVDVVEALGARGYPEGLEARLHLNVHDDQLPWNSGHLTLAVSDGAATVSHGGRGTLSITAAGLAALYTGYKGPVTLAREGMLEGSAEALRVAAAVFAGPAPCTVDAF